jgi:AraC-like DNA-binding protein
LLITWFIFTSGSFILLAGVKSVLLKDFGHMMNLSIFLTAPIMYIYFKTLFVPQFRISAKDLVHTIPFFLILLYMINKILIQKTIGVVFYPLSIYMISALFIQNSIYFYFILKDMRAFEGNKYKSRIRIYRFILYSVLAVFLLKLMIFVTWNILNYVEVCIFMTAIFFTIVFIIINTLVLFSLNNPDLLTGTFKYQASDISESELKEHMKRIKDFLTEGKAYTDPLLSLERLAKCLKIQEKLLSQVINQSSGYNFNDFINSYRIEYVIEMMKNSDMKILEIAYESGFNSKTTFNTAFKKFTGSTPSEYKKKLITGSI